MKQLLSLQVGLLAVLFSFGVACSKSDKNDDAVASSWKSSVCQGSGACIQFTKSTAGDADPTCAKFEKFSTVAKSSCDATCIGKCVDATASYYTFTKFYYGPEFADETAKADCAATVAAIAGASGGTYVSGCAP